MVFHILKDGTTTTDITGHVVKVSDAESLYKLIDSINGGSRSIRKKPERKRVCSKG